MRDRQGEKSVRARNGGPSTLWAGGLLRRVGGADGNGLCESRRSGFASVSISAAEGRRPELRNRESGDSIMRLGFSQRECGEARSYLLTRADRTDESHAPLAPARPADRPGQKRDRLAAHGKSPWVMVVPWPGFGATTRLTWADCVFEEKCRRPDLNGPPQRENPPG